MSPKPKILLVHLTQYGRHTNSYKYCQYLQDHYALTYLCLDQGYPKIEDNTTVIYLKKEKSAIANSFKMIHKARQIIQRNDYRIVYLFYFKLCSLIKPFQRSNFLLDIRTGAIDQAPFKRWRHNSMIHLESYLFDHITIISEGLRHKLKIHPKRTTLLPLGADLLSSQTKEYEHFSLIYMGTLTQRNIHQTIEGLALYIQETQPHTPPLRYDIFGDGHPKDVAQLKATITKYGLDEIVHYHGRKPHHELQPYFDTCNVGISYIPMQEYFEYQPPTKTFEYINAGMVCLATATHENRQLINEKNGILFEDNPDAFNKALHQLYQRRSSYQTATITNSLLAYRWKNIVHHRLLPLLKTIEHQKKGAIHV